MLGEQRLKGCSCINISVIILIFNTVEELKCFEFRALAPSGLTRGAATERQHLAASLLNSGDATLTTSVAAVYVSLSLPHINERETDLTLVLGDRFNEEEDGCSLSNSLSSLRSASSPRNHLCWNLSFVAQATWSPLGRMVTHGKSHSSVQRARLAAACTSDGTLAFVYAACSPRRCMGGWYGSLTCWCAACSPRGRCTSFTALASAVRRASGGITWCSVYDIFTQGLLMWRSTTWKNSTGLCQRWFSSGFLIYCFASAYSRHRQPICSSQLTALLNCTSSLWNHHHYTNMEA